MLPSMITVTEGEGDDYTNFKVFGEILCLGGELSFNVTEPQNFYDLSLLASNHSKIFASTKYRPYGFAIAEFKSNIGD